MLSAGHTYVLLATAVRKTARHANQFYRIQRPNNGTAQDMQEGSLLQVRTFDTLLTLCVVAIAALSSNT